SDFFALLAIKPEDACEISPREFELRAIAEKSMVQRTAVNLSSRQNSSAPDPVEQANLIHSLEGRLIRRPGSDVESEKAFFVQNGVRRWVLSKKWLDAQGFWYPDDVTTVPPEVLSQLPEGAEIAD